MNDHPDANAVQLALLRAARLELIPMKSLESQLPHLPAGSSVSVTCSPAKGLEATLELTARLLDLGHHPVPHLSARLTEDREHVVRLATWCRDHGIDEVFLVAGDAPEPVGSYEGVVPFLRDLLDVAPALRRIGVTAYPDGHALIDRGVVHEALHAKQQLLVDAGIEGYASTQMCFDADLWRTWAASERAAGLKLPLHLGVPGAIERMRLVTMGARLGVGSSMRYVRKNRGALLRMFAPKAYEPGSIIATLSKHAADLTIEGLHVFTFNSVEATEAWRTERIGRLTRRS